MTSTVTRKTGHAPARTVLLLGNYRPAIAIARALAKEGIRVIVGGEGEPLGAHCSRYVDEIWDHPKLADDEMCFLDALMDLLSARPDIEAVLPVTEEFALFLAAHEEQVKSRVRLASPRRATIEVFNDKLAALTLAQEQGVPTLPFAHVNSYGSLLDEARTIGFPLTVRGIGATARIAGRKALICEDMAALKNALPTWPEDHSSLLLQRFAHGTRRNIYFASQQGRLIGVCQTQILRTNAPDGTGLAVDGATEQPDGDLVADTEKLVAATNYTGIGLAQFIVDPARHERCFLELNPRVSGSHAVAERAGLPLSLLAVELSQGERDDTRPAHSEASYAARTGLRYAWTDGDLLAAKYAVLDGTISPRKAALWVWKAVRSAFAADIQMVWSWRDPGPTLISLLLLLPRCRSLRRALRAWFERRRTLSGSTYGVPASPSDPVSDSKSNSRALSQSSALTVERSVS